jgi:type IV fimbrial biogenesis protein FimT
MRLRTQQGGFTLLELMTAVGIIAVIGAMSVPSISRLIDGGRISSASRELVLDFSLARNEAVQRGSRVTVCTSTNMTSCSNNDWTDGRLTFVDGGAVGAINAGDVILSTTAALHDSITATQSGGATAHFISFEPTGRIVGPAQISYCAAGQQRRDIDLRRSGTAFSNRTTTAC